METVLAFVIGALYAAAIYLMLARSMVSLILGLAILGNAANLLIFTAARLTRAEPPLVDEGMTVPDPGYADPVPQALILTAIVIGFGVLAFALVLAYRGYRTVGTDDVDAMTATDRLDAPSVPEPGETPPAKESPLPVRPVGQEG